MNLHLKHFNKNKFYVYFGYNFIYNYILIVLQKKKKHIFLEQLQVHKYNSGFNNLIFFLNTILVKYEFDY